VQCTTSLCRLHTADGFSLFNETASQTFVASNKHTYVKHEYASTWFKGGLGKDTANIAGITVEHQQFLDATDVSARGFFSFYRFYDGVLGLAPFDPSNRSELESFPSLFQSMVRDKLITHNVFTLELPQGSRFIEGARTPGSIRFGHPRLNSTSQSVITLPLSERSIEDQTWYSPGSGFDWDNGDLQLQIGPHYPIQIDPGYLHIGLPNPLASIINRQISLPGEEPLVDCDRRKKLPSLVFTFDGETRLEITPMDYTLERLFENGTSMACMSLFHDLESFPGIVIGAGVLENYVTEWDLDAKEIRCKFDVQFSIKLFRFCFADWPAL
jgi:saccharopepsin